VIKLDIYPLEFLRYVTIVDLSLPDWSSGVVLSVISATLLPHKEGPLFFSAVSPERMPNH